jgi:hypothetical protein
MDNERVKELAKMLLELRMATSQSDAEKRAMEIISTTDGSGPTVSALNNSDKEQEIEAAPKNAPIEPTAKPEPVEAAPQEPTPQEPTPIDTTALTNVPDVEVAEPEEPTPEPEETKERPVEQMPTQGGPLQRGKIISPIDDARRELAAAMATQQSEEQQLEEVSTELETLKEDETKESLNAGELEGEMEKLRRELENSRKEVEMLRHKLQKTEDALQKAQESVNMSDRQISQPQPRPPVPNHEKPRGTNPTVDLGKIFGKR